MNTLLLHVDEPVLNVAVRRFLIAVIVSICPSLAPAQSANDAKARKAEADKMIGEESVAYKIALAADDRNLSLHPVPVKSWTNDLNGEFYGSVFIWTLDGRPQVVGSLYRSYTPFNYFAAELQSLSEHELLAAKDEQAVWQPPAGVKFQSVPDGATPSQSHPVRLIQMRSLARLFAGQLTDEDKVRRTLQISPQPLYRYDKTPANLLDGAMFSLVNGTDPEVLLLIEARRTADGFQWQYALARLCVSELQVTYNGQKVWSAAPLEWPYTRLREPYTIIRRDFDAAK